MSLYGIGSGNMEQRNLDFWFQRDGDALKQHDCI